MFKVKASNGEAFLGGDDINNNLTNYFLEHFQKQYNVDLKKNYKALARLRQQAEIAKKTLSHVLEHEIAIDYIDDNNEYDFECTISRKVFENLNMELFNTTIKSIEKTLEEAKMMKEDIDDILLVGGSTRIPFVSIVNLLKTDSNIFEFLYFFFTNKYPRIEPFIISLNYFKHD